MRSSLHALVFDRQLGLNNLPPMLRTLAGFVIFCLLSGVVYIINDIADVEADRRAPEETQPPDRLRPAADPGRADRRAVVILAGDFPARLLAFPGLCGGGTGLFLAQPGLFEVDQAHRHPGCLFHCLGLRAACGSRGDADPCGALLALAVCGHHAGFAVYRLWQAPRRAGLLAEQANAHRKVLSGYTLPMLDQYITIVSATTIMAYSLYTFSAPNLPDNHVMMLTIPFVLYGIFRYLYLIQTQGGGGAPEEILFRDRPLQVDDGCCGAHRILLIFYIF